jgi:uncharacterized SAM-binding protein YcdF (DUF218 family)
MFIIKKIVAPFFLPTALIFSFLLLGICFLWFTRKQKFGKLLVTVSFVILTLCSYNTFGNVLLGGLEQQYPPLLTVQNLADVPWVVVLGGGIAPDKNLPDHDQLADTSLSRLIEGIRIHRQIPGSRLLLSGGAVFGTVTEAAVMAETAVSLGVNRQDLLLDTRSKDSKDQAREVKNTVGSRRFILVTSAAHMPRVMALFEKQGLTPIPAPTDFRIKKRQHISPGMFFPGANNLRKAEYAIHEYLGLIWAKLRRQA